MQAEYQPVPAGDYRSVAAGWLQEEIVQLERLQRLMNDERECLTRMDGQSLAKITRDKAVTIERLQTITDQRDVLGVGERAAAGRDPELADILRRRNDLVRHVQEQNRAQSVVIKTQSEQVSQLLAFIRNVKSQSKLYDRSGKLREK